MGLCLSIYLSFVLSLVLENSWVNYWSTNSLPKKEMQERLRRKRALRWQNKLKDIRCSKKKPCVSSHKVGWLGFGAQIRVKDVKDKATNVCI